MLYLQLLQLYNYFDQEEKLEGFFLLESLTKSLRVVFDRSKSGLVFKIFR